VERIHFRTGASTSRKRLLVKLTGIDRRGREGSGYGGEPFSAPADGIKLQRVLRAVSRVMWAARGVQFYRPFHSHPDIVGEKAITLAPL
jgi:hypothetical protein